MEYSIKVYRLSYDDNKTLKILDVYGNANFEIHIVSIANVKEVMQHEIL